VQVVSLLLCFFGLGIVLKAHGYPESAVFQWSSWALFLRENGLWLLALPIMWACYASLSVRRDKGIFSSSLATVVGLVLTVSILFCFFYAMMWPVERLR
jgi:hypothetical protein